MVNKLHMILNKLADYSDRLYLTKNEKFERKLAKKCVLPHTTMTFNKYQGL